jgi:hypothetical protein
MVVAGRGDMLGATMRLVARMHPSGGLLGFAGMFTEANRAVMESTLNEFLASTLLVPRPTQTDVVNYFGGRAFQWVKSSNIGGGFSSSSLSSWSQSYSYFCPDGTYEVDPHSSSSFSGTLSSASSGDYLGYYRGGSSGSTRQTGQWTVIASIYGPIMVMESSSGFQLDLLTLNGNSLVFGDQEFQFYQFHNCH